MFWGNSKTLMRLERRVIIGREGGGKGREAKGASLGGHGGLWGKTWACTLREIGSLEYCEQSRCGA